MIDKLQAIQERYSYLETSLADPEVLGDMKRYKSISKEYKDLEEIVGVSKTYLQLISNIDEAREMESDPEMQAMAKEELQELLPQKESLEEQIKQLLIPKDPEDDKDAIVEIRSGTGGDEASIFAGDLYRMYTKFFDDQKWKHEIVALTEGAHGGYSKIVLEVIGNGVYGKMKFESGAHRVQRVPKTESQGRVHTSAATVAIMPKLEMEDVEINKADLNWDTFRASGAGGQHVNKTESAVRVTHVPTGVVVECQDGRSQIKNREIAMTRLIQKIKEQKQADHDQKIVQKRRSLVASGDRSAKVRTYNFPQNRVTDHRIGLTLYNLSNIIEGDINELIESLQVAENAQKMQEGSGDGPLS